MSVEDTFEGAKSAFTFYRGFINTVTQELGAEKVLNLSKKTAEFMGTMQGMLIKEQLGNKEFGIEEVTKIVSEQNKKTMGIISEAVDVSSNKITRRAKRCPIYEAAKTLGIEDKDIESYCHAGSMTFLNSMVKQLNPNLSFELTRFRSSADDSCEESIILSE